MDEIFTRILEIEQSSIEIVSEAEQKKRDIDAIINAEKEKLHNVILQEERIKIAKEKNEIIQKAKNNAASYLSRSQKKIDAMDKMDKASRSGWVDQLYHKVLSQ